MKKIKIDIHDLLAVLEAMIESNGTKEIIFFEHGQYPAICDADDPDSIISFASVNESGEVDETDEVLH
jgi:hypothetical protein